MKNTAKYLSYKAAWERMALAIKQGFFLEAVALSESIISDRLISYLEGVGGKPVPLRTSFHALISSWKRHSEVVAWKAHQDLPADVDTWRKERNAVIHGLVKSRPGTATKDVASFLERARTCADQGQELARAVCAWHKHELRASKRGVRTNGGTSASR